LSRLSGKSGKVIAIEPMSKFNRVLGNLLKKKGAQNVELLQLALGGEGEFVEMGIPLVNKAKKFAYARVMKSSTHLDYVESEKIRNAYGDQLLAGLPRLDFIKCDVEGLEVQVFSSMLHVLEKHYPILLCELADQQERVHFLDMIAPMGYKAFILREKKLHPIDVYSAEKAISHNHYFIPSSRMQGMSSLISAK
jgi:FkbM family methyltransferase